MPIQTVAGLVEALGRYPLLEPRQQSELVGLQSRCASAEDLARELVKREWLTSFQSQYLLMGQAQALVLGSYIVLKRLGEGTVGVVFKARDRENDRLVSLKVIRSKLMEDPEIVHRFDREIRATAQLSHPNIISFVDADLVDEKWFFAMEYFEGVDLGKLVKKDGPLAVLQACDYIRQAALGLQHAHERGLVHRDIKPTNLLVTPVPPWGQEPPPRQPGQPIDWGTIKVLDLGLARLKPKTTDLDGSNIITRVGWVMGTPDFISPEQALNAHAVDIRSDLYSLGCTFYYLLTGQPPFFDSSGVQKLLQHRKADPPPIDELRPGVPDPVAALVRKLMAKRPEDRPRVPAVVAGELAALIASMAASPTLETRPGRRSVAVTPRPGKVLDTAKVGAGPHARGRPRWQVVVSAVAGILLVLGLLALAVMLLK